MAMFSIDLSKSRDVNLTVNQIDEDEWIVDIGSPSAGAVLTLNTQQVVNLGLISPVEDDPFDYNDAAWQYLLGVIEADENFYTQSYHQVVISMEDLYGADFDMDKFADALDDATKELKSYIRGK